LSHRFQVCDPPKTEFEPQFSPPSAPSFLKLALSISLLAPVPTGLKLSAGALNPPSLSSKTPALPKPFGKIFSTLTTLFPF
jgi:hypothetical protein